jgi:hypothetical protein
MSEKKAKPKKEPPPVANAAGLPTKSTKREFELEIIR